MKFRLGCPDRRERHRRIEEAEKYKGARKASVPAYLASVSVVGDMAGVELDALKDGKYEVNTSERGSTGAGGLFGKRRHGSR